MSFHLLAQGSISVLIVAASVIPIVAGLSALRKWSAAQEALAEWSARDARLRVLIEKHDETLAAHRASGGDAAGTRALQARYEEDRKAQGFPLKTYTDHDVELTLGERPRHGFQAPVEVKWAIFALSCAAVAGVWDVWLG